MSTLQQLAAANQEPDVALVPHSVEIFAGESCLGNFARQNISLADSKNFLRSYRASPVFSEIISERILRDMGAATRLHTYAGEWVAMQGNQMVSHGADPVRVAAEARERGVRVPYLFRVQDSDEDVVKIGL